MTAISKANTVIIKETNFYSESPDSQGTIQIENALDLVWSALSHFNFNDYFNQYKEIGYSVVHIWKLLVIPYELFNDAIEMFNFPSE